VSLESFYVNRVKRLYLRYRVLFTLYLEDMAGAIEETLVKVPYYTFMIL